MDSISQVLEQKAEWLTAAQSGDHFDKSGTRRLEAGNRAEFDESDNLRDATVKRDTFELFRRDTRTLEIVTFDELLDRAKFITKD